jgi:hypothetical protein
LVSDIQNSRQATGIFHNFRLEFFTVYPFSSTGGNYPQHRHALGWKAVTALPFFPMFIHVALHTVCSHTAPKIGNKYSQKWNCVASSPLSAFIYLWAIYIFPRWVTNFAVLRLRTDCGTI